MIITGGSPEQREDAARAVAQAFLCTGAEGERPCLACLACRKAGEGIHPDVLRWQGEKGKPLSVGQVRELRSDAYIRPNEGRWKVYLLPGADRLNDSAQNAMLKLLEDGPAYAAFLLLCENGERLLPTVRSRCGTMYLGGVVREEPAPVAAAAEQLCQRYLAEDEEGFFTALVPCEKWEREQFLLLLDEFIAWLRRALVGRPGGEDTRKLLRGVAAAEQVRRACERNGGIGHLCGWLAGALFSGEAASETIGEKHP